MAILPHSVTLNTATVHIYAHPELSGSSKSSVLFVLHGHPASARHMHPIVNGVFDLTAERSETGFGDPKRNLVVVTFVSEITHTDITDREFNLRYL
jgi:hypothetical protein